MSGFDKFICPTCRGTGIMERARHVSGPDDYCYILHRQYGMVKRCLRADIGKLRMCDQPYPGVPATSDGTCPIAAVEEQRRGEDHWIQAQTILRACGKNPLDALRLDDIRGEGEE